MIFTTYWFCLFALGFFPLYWAARPAWLRFALLLGLCLVFHAHFAGAAGVAPIIVLALLAYSAGLSGRKWALYGAMAAAVLALVVYKYSHFIALDVIGALNPSLGKTLDGFARRWLPITPPLAVSFFTFEFVHYLYDVRKGSPPLRNPAHFGAFTFFFPSLVAGPIKRYQPFIATLQEGLARVSVDDVKLGLVRVAIGLIKKIVIADNLTAAIAFWQPHFAELPFTARWALVGAM
ncbi:MAG TPA: hypothetical protein VN689_10355, partial [Burkholderiales bacterium]|nr:hypothetical protein [Burkholderiales bacterium]